MKNEKTVHAELVRAAQTAGADESAEFWRQVAAHSGLKQAERVKTLVQPRNLTDVPKSGTV